MDHKIAKRDRTTEHKYFMSFSEACTFADWSTLSWGDPQRRVEKYRFFHVWVQITRRTRGTFNQSPTYLWLSQAANNWGKCHLKWEFTAIVVPLMSLPPKTGLYLCKFNEAKRKNKNASVRTKGKTRKNWFSRRKCQQLIKANLSGLNDWPTKFGKQVHIPKKYYLKLVSPSDWRQNPGCVPLQSTLDKLQEWIIKQQFTEVSSKYCITTLWVEWNLIRFLKRLICTGKRLLCWKGHIASLESLSYWSLQWRKEFWTASTWTKLNYALKFQRKEIV